MESIEGERGESSDDEELSNASSESSSQEEYAAFVAYKRTSRLSVGQDSHLHPNNSRFLSQRKGRRRKRKSEENADARAWKRNRMLRQVEDLPAVDPATVQLTRHEKFECKKCATFRGCYVLKPCGHAQFCGNCVTKLRDKAIRTERLVKCPNADCLSLINGWLYMRNVNIL